MTAYNAPYDLAVIGGGINGCGIARDAAGRGLSTYLCERDDLASATSSASTKLIHGGLRYLEHMQFRLVRESLAERDVLLRSAPHLVRPLSFILPWAPGLRPYWILRFGLFLYDFLGQRQFLPASRALDLRVDPSGVPLLPAFQKGFEYADCWVDDARLVILNARDAAERGAVIDSGTRCIRARRDAGRWCLTVVSRDSSREYDIWAKVLVNASGPWVNDVMANVIDGASSHAGPREKVRLVRGSHIVVPKQFSHEKAYILQHTDRRVIFALPFEDDFTLIGTTDLDYSGDPSDACCSGEETAYLCAAVSRYFRYSVCSSDVVWTYSGVRPLYDDGASASHAVTRDYVLRVERPSDSTPVLHVFGGKITTYRKLAESALERLREFFPGLGPSWTEDSCLPGGDFDPVDFDRHIADLLRAYPFLDVRQAHRLFSAYGTCVNDLLGDASCFSDLGEAFGAGLTVREVQWMIQHEWARSADDVLWRRSRLGLRVTREEAGALDTWIRSQVS